MKTPVNYTAIREAAQAPASRGDGWIIPNALHPDTLDAMISEASSKRFPAHRDPQGFIPLLPYQALEPVFRQLLLELASSIMIRSMEKTASITGLIHDPLYEQAALGQTADIQAAARKALDTPHPCGLTPALACMTPLENTVVTHGTELQPGDFWVQPAEKPLPAFDNESGRHFFFLYYRHQSAIDHGKVQLI